MESIATILPRSMNGAAKKSRTTLGELITELKEYEARDNADDVVRAAELHMIDGEHVATPAGAEYRLNDWSRQQLARLLGVRWERWFANADGRAVADEINRRLLRTHGELRLRSRRTTSGADELRAVLSPSFTAVPDSTIASAVRSAIGHAETDMPVLRFALTERSTTIMLGVGRPFHPGGDARVGEVWGSLLLRNSSTGFAALACHLSLLRLACLNGMVVPHDDAVVLRRVHRGLDAGVLEERLYSRLRGLPGRLRGGADALASSVQVPVGDIDDEVRRFLVDARIPQRLATSIRAAYEREPHPSVFGLAQAVTLAAQDLAPEDRYELELAAGRYVRERTQLVA